MKLTTKDKDVSVSVITDAGDKYGIVVGTYNHIVCVLLNIGEYVDVPDHKVKRITKKPKFVDF